MKVLYSALLFLFLLLPIPKALSQAIKSDHLRVFLDCQAYCDKDYIKREITFVDYVNDRFQANVYILATSRTTGSGGREYILTTGKISGKTKSALWSMARIL